MASTIFPQTLSPIKSIQRGSTASAGNITISSIDTSKSFIRSYSTGSAGSVGVSGSESGTLNPTGSYNFGGTGGGNASSGGGSFPSYAGTRSTGAGGTSITVSEYGAYIVNSTTITTTGACRWEVVEYS
jgi:hypothetical protein